LPVYAHVNALAQKNLPVYALVDALSQNILPIYEFVDACPKNESAKEEGMMAELLLVG
jgi:hypothetical protein